jgi:tricorn protease
VVDAEHELDSVALHPSGLSVAITSRGQAFSMGLFDGPVLSYQPVTDADAQEPEAAMAPRCRLLSYLWAWPQVRRITPWVDDYVSSMGGNPSVSVILSRPRSTGFTKRLTCPLGLITPADPSAEPPQLVMVTDATGEEALEVHTEDGSLPARRLTVDPLVLGCPTELVPSPEGPLLAVVIPLPATRTTLPLHCVIKPSALKPSAL